MPTVYVCLDNHKIQWSNKEFWICKTWTSLVNNLPERTLIWNGPGSVKKELLFLATNSGFIVL